MKHYAQFCINLISFCKGERYVGLVSIVVMFVVVISCKENESLKRTNTVTTKPALSNPTLTVPTPPLENCSSHILYGYCDKISYHKGDKITVYIQSNASVAICRLDIFDLNHKFVFSAPSKALSPQSIAVNDPSANGYGFVESASIDIPVSIQSGVYLIDGKIPFIVKEKNPDLVIVYPSNTANAYSESGGKSLYTSDRPTQVSFERPIAIQPESIPCLKWFSTIPNLRVGYAADIDMTDDFDYIGNAKILVIVGHSEYWTWHARKNFDKFVKDGGHAIILSGNTMWWQVRHSSDKKALICHKNALDPVAESWLKTINWLEPSLNYPIIPSIGGDFRHGGYGIRYADDGWDGYKIVLPESPLLNGLDFKKGDILSLPSVEYDGAPIKDFVNEVPVLDEEEIDAHQVELIGFDYGLRGGKKTVGTFIVMQPKKNSGTIVNVGSMDWCSANGIGGPQRSKIQQITLNAITAMLDKKSLFVQ